MRIEYVLMIDVEFGPFAADSTLPAGSYIYPIEDRYVPPHCKTSTKAARYWPDRDVFCYTKYGIIPVPMDAIRKERFGW